jgi:hypothetical protein
MSCRSPHPPITSMSHSDWIHCACRREQDLALKPEIARVIAENFAVYGVRKVWRQMSREGFAIARCTVVRGDNYDERYSVN